MCWSLCWVNANEQDRHGPCHHETYCLEEDRGKKWSTCLSFTPDALK